MILKPFFTGKARPLLMTGGKKGMRFCTLKDLNRFEAFGDMFPDGKDPLAKLYRDADVP